MIKKEAKKNKEIKKSRKDEKSDKNKQRKRIKEERKKERQRKQQKLEKMFLKIGIGLSQEIVRKKKQNMALSFLYFYFSRSPSYNSRRTN